MKLVDPASVDVDTMNGIARTILSQIDAPRRKSEVPPQPVLVEMFGMPKAGKDTQFPRIERFFKRNGYNVLIRQESAETQQIRAMHRNAVGPYGFEMRHFVYSFGNLLDAISSRDFHMVMQNRGIVDTLCWLEWNALNNTFSREQVQQARSFILPWIQSLDAVVFLDCGVETSLQREYGTLDLSGVKFGSRMNPESLRRMKEAVDRVFQDIQSLGAMPLVRIDTSRQTIDETTHDILSQLCVVLTHRYNISAEEIALRSLSFLRSQKVFGRLQLKFKGAPPIAPREKGWFVESIQRQRDTYLEPKAGYIPGRDECFHIRQSEGCGDALFIYKQSGQEGSLRLQVPPIPVSSPASMVEIMESFNVLCTISKQRTIYTRDGFTLAVDRVDELGVFTEVKAPAGIDRAALLAQAFELGFTDTDGVPSSYLRMMQEKTR